MGLLSSIFKRNEETEKNVVKIKKADYNQIKCPYCFQVFGHKDVHFKAMTLKDADLYGNRLDDMPDDDDDGFDFFQEAKEKPENEDTVDKSLNELFTEKEDLAYENFWKKYANNPEWKYVNYPVITNRDSRMMQGGFHLDQDGFTDSVTDAFGEVTKVRICPYCHNPLPSNYGKYPVHFIATVGITSSGKTVYLSQLMRHMDEIMANVGLGTLSMTEADTRFVREHQVKKDVPLPQGTTPGALSEPLFYVILNNGQYHTLVFYDVAGENCVNQEEMGKFGPFIENADGIIMILDPGQFSKVSENYDNEIAGPKAVLQTMFNSFLASKNVGGKTAVPLAVSLSKSDCLQNSTLLAQNSNIFKEVSYDLRNPGFDRQQYRNVMGEVKKFLNEANEGRQLMMIMQNCFVNYGFFAFSALNCQVETEEIIENGQTRTVAMPKSHPIPLRIEEPFLWILNQFGIVKTVNGNQ